MIGLLAELDRVESTGGAIRRSAELLGIVASSRSDADNLSASALTFRQQRGVQQPAVVPISGGAR